ncbi:MAG: DUF3726 domain-containing protein [Candidatus Puniceispirillaceae bacterium]
MSWSLGETAALALKAARGGGLSWGLAEEAAAAVIWLHTNNLPGISALCSYLGNPDDGPRTDGACPILTGCALIDGAMPIPAKAGEMTDIGPVRAPLLLLPFVARLDDGAIWLLASRTTHQDDHSIDGNAGDSFASHYLSGAAGCRLVRRTCRQVISPRPEVLRLADHFACCVERLGTFAHRTYAPATGQSRLSGAGAGLTDND